MPTAPGSPTPPYRRRPGSVALVVLGLVLVFGGIMGSAWAAQPTVPPPPTQPAQPTQAPISTLPPLPTQPPQPTQPPPPTEVPPTQIPPTAPPPPTEVPPTQIPPTEQPTEAPTQTPEPFPSTPSAPPPAPPDQPVFVPSGPIDAGEVDVNCLPFVTVATPVINLDGWDLRRCTIPLDLNGIDSLDIRVISSDPGWRVVLLDADDASTPGLLNASNNRTVIDEFDAESAEFLLGTQFTCSGLGDTTLDFVIEGAVDGQDAPLSASGTLALEAPALSTAEVVLTAASIDTTSETPVGSFALTWERNQPGSCPWHIVLTLAGTEGIEVMEVNGSTGIAAVSTAGAVVITIPPAAQTGEALLTLAFPSGPPTAVGLEAQVRP